jgi:uncharacterized protein YecT (DUF1311 family)
VVNPDDGVERFGMKSLSLIAAAFAGLLYLQPAWAEASGPDSNPCADQVSTVAIAECLQARAKVWDLRLNTAYMNLMQRIDAGQRDPLKQAQRLWIQYRDANCRFYGAQEGTIRQIEAAECLRSMTQNRALELEKAMKFD